MKVSVQEIYNYLREKGLSHQHAVGMVANIKAESDFDPGAIGDNGTSGGLFQHHDGKDATRFTAMKEFAGENWKTNWKAQIDYALTEKDTELYLSKNFNTSEEASKWFTINWERPKNADIKATRRAELIPELIPYDRFNLDTDKEVTINGQSYVLYSKDDKTYALRKDVYDNEKAKHAGGDIYNHPFAKELPYNEEQLRKKINEGSIIYDPSLEINTKQLLQVKDGLSDKELKEAIKKSSEDEGVFPEDAPFPTPDQPFDFTKPYENKDETLDLFIEEQKRLEEDAILAKEGEGEGEPKPYVAPEDPAPLGEGLYTDDEGNYWQKGRDGNWRVKYSQFANPDDEFDKTRKYGEWQSLEGEKFDAPHEPSLKAIDENTAGNILKMFETDSDGDGVDDGFTSIEKGDERAPLRLESAGLFEKLGGISSLISALFARKGLKEAMKDIDIPNTPGLSQTFKRYLYESEQLAKSGMDLNEQQAVQQNIDIAYEQGIDNLVRGTGGDRAKFLAGLGVLDTQRQSSLLKAAAVNDEIKRKNRAAYEKAMYFKENFEANKATAERNEELQAALAKKAAYGQMGSNALKTIMDNIAAAKMYGTGSPYDKMIQMKMYNMGYNPSEQGGNTPKILQDAWGSIKNIFSKKSSLTPDAGTIDQGYMENQNDIVDYGGYEQQDIG
jgi:hypothetical protein